VPAQSNTWIVVNTCLAFLNIAHDKGLEKGTWTSFAQLFENVNEVLEWGMLVFCMPGMWWMLRTGTIS
jgi:hypothetical protein